MTNFMDKSASLNLINEYDRDITFISLQGVVALAVVLSEETEDHIIVSMPCLDERQIYDLMISFL